MSVNFLNDVSLGSDIELQLSGSSGGKIFANSKFYIQGDAINFRNYAGSETYAIFQNNGAVSLNYDNSQKFITTSTGVEVIGNVRSNVSNGGGFMLTANSASGLVRNNATGVALRTNTTDQLIVDNSGNVTINEDATVTGQLTVSNGIELTSGNFNAGDNERIRLGNSADLQMYHDGSNSYLLNGTGDFYIDSNGDDLFLRSDDDVVIQSQSSENAIYCTGNAGVQIYHNNSEKLETKSDGIEVTGNIDLNSNGEIELDGNGGMLLNTAPSGTEGNGIIIKLHSTSTTAGKLYFKSNFAAAWSEVNAQGTAGDGATRMLAVALGSNSGTSGMLLQGLFRKASHGFSAGAPLYVGETNGTFTTTAPSSQNDYVRIVGYVIDSNTIYFNPSGTWVQVS